MAGKVDKTQTNLLRAVDGDSWELWNFVDGARPEFVRRLAVPSEVSSDTIVALPTENTFAFASWLSSGDEQVISEMLKLQLEQRGLLNKGNGNSSQLTFRIVEKQENRTLAVAAVLQSEFPPQLAFEKALFFEPSVFTFPLPEDRLVVWREIGRLSVVATRGREPVAFQVLAASELSDAAVLELKCICFQLEAQGLCERLKGVTLWGNFSQEETKRLQNALGLSVSNEPLPPPCLPAKKAKLLPIEVATLHAKKRTRARIRTAIMAAAALYLLAIASLVGYIGYQRYVAGSLSERLASQEPTVTAVQSTADRWRQVQWAVDPHLYLAELLYQVASLLPSNGLRLTALDAQKGKVIIKGEASGAPAAFKLAEDIKQDPELRMFSWEMPSPSLRPDGRAEFTIQGEPKFAKID